VFYDRAVGSPYIEIKLNRDAIARYGLTINEVQDVLQSAVGGMALTTTVEGRERFPVRVRYPRELRTTPEDMKKILVPAMSGVQIPLGELADLQYTRGPQMIRSENTFLTGYVIFDKQEGVAEVDAVEKLIHLLRQRLNPEKLYYPLVFLTNLQELRATDQGYQTIVSRYANQSCTCFYAAFLPVQDIHSFIYPFFRGYLWHLPGALL